MQWFFGSFPAGSIKGSSTLPFFNQHPRVPRNVNAPKKQKNMSLRQFAEFVTSVAPTVKPLKNSYPPERSQREEIHGARKSRYPRHPRYHFCHPLQLASKGLQLGRTKIQLFNPPENPPSSEIFQNDEKFEVSSRFCFEKILQKAS